MEKQLRLPRLTHPLASVLDKYEGDYETDRDTATFSPTGRHGKSERRCLNNISTLREKCNACPFDEGQCDHYWI